LAPIPGNCLCKGSVLLRIVPKVKPSVLVHPSLIGFPRLKGKLLRHSLYLRCESDSFPSFSQSSSRQDSPLLRAQLSWEISNELPCCNFSLPSDFLPFTYISVGSAFYHSEGYRPAAFSFLVLSHSVYKV
jgi:hypothetical protein